jgi:hypothetical protein
MAGIVRGSNWYSGVNTPATSSNIGLVKPDGTTMEVDSNGTLSYAHEPTYLTNAEYQQLTEQEKLAGTFFITDLNGPQVAIDSSLNTSSTNAIQNAPVATAISQINTKLGNTDISGIGDGTVTGAIDALSDSDSIFKGTSAEVAAAIQQGTITSGQVVIITDDSDYTNTDPNGNLATVEYSSTASKAYSSDELVVFQGRLCKTTSAIASGATLAIGTNLQYDTVAAELSSINSDITTLNSDLSDVSAAFISAELSGVTIYNNSLYKNVKVVHLYAVMDIPAIDSPGSWIASIPSEFRPSGDRYIVGVAQDRTTKAFDISASGHLRNAESIPNKTYYFDSTWII